MIENKKPAGIESILINIIGVLLAIVFLWPVFWLIMSSFKPGNEMFSYPLRVLPSVFSFDYYKSVMANGFAIYIKNSLIVAIIATVITLLINSMCGYALTIYRHEIKHVNLIFGIFLLGTLVPGEVITVPQFAVISNVGLYNNLAGVILPTVTTTTGIFMFRQFFLSIPLELAESGRIDGAGEFKIFFSIMMPLAKSVTVTLTIFSFMWRWNDYILPLLVLSEQKQYTIQIAIKNFIGTNGVDWRSILASSVISIVPVLILFAFLQKYIMGGLATSGLKG